MTYFDLVRAGLRRAYPHRPRFRAKVERALVAVFNYDMQAIVEAFYYDTFEVMGVQLDRAVGEIASAVEYVAQGTERQTQMVESASRAACDVASAVSESAQAADETARVAGDAREITKQGMTAATEASDAMSLVRDNARDVAEAIRSRR